MNSVEEFVVKYRSPSEDRLVQATSPESSPYQIDPSNRDSPWTSWYGPQTMLPPVKTESTISPGKTPDKSESCWGTSRTAPAPLTT